MEEGARLVFDLGPTLPRSSVSLLRVEAAGASEAQREDVTRLTRNVNGFAWVRSGALENEAAKPAVEVAVGRNVRLVAVSDGGGYHNLAIPDAEGARVAGPTEAVTKTGEEAVLTWRPDAPGRYRYACPLHPDAMAGDLVVA